MSWFHLSHIGNICDLRYFAVIYSTELTLHSHWYKGKHDNVIYNMTLHDDLSSITV